MNGVKAFCREAGFHPNKYYYWQCKLRQAACHQLTETQPLPCFVEVRQEPAPVHPALPEPTGPPGGGLLLTVIIRRESWRCCCESSCHAELHQQTRLSYKKSVILSLFYFYQYCKVVFRSTVKRFVRISRLKSTNNYYPLIF